MWGGGSPQYCQSEGDLLSSVRVRGFDYSCVTQAFILQVSLCGEGGSPQ